MFQLYEEEIKRLINNLNRLKDHYKICQSRLVESQKRQQELELKVKQQEQKIIDIEKKYQNLIDNRTLGVDETHRHQTEKRIDILVREIDDCIALLNK